MLEIAMIELTNRELATTILFAVFVSVFMLIPRLRRQVGPDLANLFKIFFRWKIQVSLLAYFVYAATVICLALWCHIWELVQLKDTLLIVLFVGLPLVFGANQVNDGKKLVASVVRDAVGVSTLLVFYVNIVSLPLWGELLLQPVIAFASLLAVVAQRHPGQRNDAKLMNIILGTIGCGLFIYTTKTIVSSWHTDDWSVAAKSLALSIWLPTMMIPFVYVFTFIISVESLLTMLPFHNDRKNPSLRVRCSIIWGLHLSTRLASELTGRWRVEAAQTRGFRDGLRVMSEFRQATKKRDGERSAYFHRLKQMAGVAGVDDAGLQLDRREFSETKKVLTDLYFMQMGWFRNHDGAYRPELLKWIGDLARNGLPADHGIHLQVRKDRQTWRAWRKTPSGWFFGVGGTSDIESKWQYDGSSKPNGYPSDKRPGWINATLQPSSKEWATNDSPPNWT